jgi:hypothetical protein
MTELVEAVLADTEKSDQLPLKNTLKEHNEKTP